MKILCSLWLLLQLSIAVNAQIIKADWSEKLKTVSGAYKDYQYDKSIATGNGSFISSYKSFGNIDIKLLKFSETMELLKELVFELNKIKFFGSAPVSYSNFVKIENKYFVVLEEDLSKEKTKNIYFQEIDVEKMAVSGDAKKIASFDVSEDNSAEGPVPVHFDYSVDSSKLLLCYQPELKKKISKFIQLVSLNKNLEKLSNITFDFGKPSKQVFMSNISIDHDGKVYITSNNYEKDFEKNYIKSDGEKIPSYITELTVVEGQNKTIYQINNQGKFIHQLCLVNNFNGRPVFTGLYKETHNGRVAGVFKARLELASKEVNVNFSSFNDSFLSMIEEDGFGKMSGAKKGIDNEFIVRQITSVSDGFIYMMAEYDGYATWGDLVIATFKPDGKVVFARLPKNQQLDGVPYANFSWEKWKGWGYSFCCEYYNGNLLIFYNDKLSNVEKDIDRKADMVDKLEKSSFVYGLLSHDGKLIKRQEVFSHKELDKYITSINLCTLSDNKIAMHGLKSGAFRNAIKMGMLTIK